jgi:tRNA modification GTPase
MYNLNDTIVAVSSPVSGARSIVRITGPATIEICRRIFRPDDTSLVLHPSSLVPRLVAGCVAIDDELEIDAHLYLFFAPHSYTGDDVAEIHIYANDSVTESLVNKILKGKSVGQAPPYNNNLQRIGNWLNGKFSHQLPITNHQLPITNYQICMAGPGEFTARAYLNGKLDLAQAEAVNEIVVSSNTFQLAAAEKLLSGSLGQATEKVRSAMMDCLSLIEAGLDFSEETIEFINRQEAVERLTQIKDQLGHLLSAGLSYESIIDLPAVGIAGAPNAGKSSLLNKLLGTERSIVSEQSKTTRDVLSGLLTLTHYKCVLFDCAGLALKTEDRRQKLRPLSSVLDELAQQAAIEALANSDVVIFCVDISKEDWTDDILVKRLVEPKVLVPIATKCDLVAEKELTGRLRKLHELFNVEFLPISVKTGASLKTLLDTIDRKIVEKFKIPHIGGVTLTARHRQAVTESKTHISEAVNECKAGNDEVAAMMLRAAYQAISSIEQSAAGGVDEQILDQIFSRFCIGK